VTCPRAKGCGHPTGDADCDAVRPLPPIVTPRRTTLARVKNGSAGAFSGVSIGAWALLKGIPSSTGGGVGAADMRVCATVCGPPTFAALGLFSCRKARPLRQRYRRLLPSTWVRKPYDGLRIQTCARAAKWACFLPLG
jgi:hypothetical protein